MTTMVLIRHEETEWNKTSRYHGHADTKESDIFSR